MLSKSIDNDVILINLQRRWWLLTAVWSIAILTSFATLRRFWPDSAVRWLLMAGLISVYSLWLVWRSLPENHREKEALLLSAFGPGNNLTLLRGLAISMVAGFIFSPRPLGVLAWLPALLYTFADIADYLDGYLARISNQATLLGARLDIEFDGLGMLIVSILGFWYGQLPWWYLLLGAARYLFVGGIWWRERQGKPVHGLPPSIHRRIIAGFQMGFMSAVLWPIIPAAGTKVAGTVFATATLVSFGRDWLIAIGRLDADSQTYQRLRQQLYRIGVIWLPPLLRLIAVLGMAGILWALSRLVSPPSWTNLLAGWHLPAPQFMAGLTALLAILSTAAVAFGAMGRVAAFILVFPIGFDMVIHGLSWSNGAALTAVTYIMLFGTGKWSIWQPEEKYLQRRAGERTQEGQG
jgi:CDP-diacylglycerol--glycerol-3-phosphate 3-phosphatidyltransferase